MSQPDQVVAVSPPSPKSLWPVAAVILGVIFAPALLAFAVALLRQS